MFKVFTFFTDTLQAPVFYHAIATINCKLSIVHFGDIKCKVTYGHPCTSPTRSPLQSRLIAPRRREHAVRERDTRRQRPAMLVGTRTSRTLSISRQTQLSLASEIYTVVLIEFAQHSTCGENTRKCRCHAKHVRRPHDARGSHH